MCPLAASSLRAFSSCCLAVAVGDCTGTEALGDRVALLRRYINSTRPCFGSVWDTCANSLYCRTIKCAQQGICLLPSRLWALYECTCNSACTASILAWSVIEWLTWPSLVKPSPLASLPRLAPSPSCPHPLPCCQGPCLDPSLAGMAWAGEAATAHAPRFAFQDLPVPTKDDCLVPPRVRNALYVHTYHCMQARMLMS